MKKSILAVTIITLLGGCEPRDDAQYIVDTLVQEEAIKASLAQANAESAELKEFLEEARKTDPSIVDAYYVINEEGDKSISVVRSETDEDGNLTGFETAVTAIAAGALAGLGGAMLANAMMPNNPPTSYTPPAPSAIYKDKDEEERKKRRGGFVSTYNSQMVANHTSSIRSNPSRMSVLSNKALTSSRPAFQGTSSARGGSYSGGS